MLKLAQPAALSTFELVAMIATMMALNALAIDVMLPALPQIARDFSVPHPNDRQLVVVVYVFSFGVAQLVYGPLADAFGRRRVLLGALGVFVLGSVVSVVAPTFSLFLAARALQGAGAAATRVIATAVVRDLTEGARMAQIMSMAMTVFMLVPILAPSLGQLILFVGPWRWIFAALLVYALALLAWTALRLPETLRPDHVIPFRPRAIASSALAVLRDRQIVGYVIASTLIAGCLFGYIASSEQIFVDVYKLGPGFALAFGAVAATMSVGLFANARIVMRYGVRRISHWASLGFVASSAILTAALALGAADFWTFLALTAATLSLFGLMGSNFGALAMQPAGRNAGAASALLGSTGSIGGAIAGGLIGRAFDGTALPFAVGLLACGVLTVVAVLWTERGQLSLRRGEGATL